jgi:hypothetical protein
MAILRLNSHSVIADNNNNNNNNTGNSLYVVDTNFLRKSVLVETCNPYFAVIEFVVNTRRNNGVFWDVTPCGSCKNRRFGGT